MAQYPEFIKTFREKLNFPGEVYAPEQPYKLFVEDLTEIEDEVIAIETDLENNIAPRLLQAETDITDNASLITALQTDKQNNLGFTPEDSANKDATTTLGTSDAKFPTQKAVKTYIDNAISAVKLAMFPVGSIFVHTSNTNPSTFIGGTWVAWGSGRVPVGVDTGQTEFNTVEKTGGAKTHTLSVAEMPSHDHEAGGDTNFWLLSADPSEDGQAGAGMAQPWRDWNWRSNVKPQGGGGAHNNLQPYITCYMFKRTA